MESERVWCELQGVGDGSGRHTFGAGLNKQPENVKPIVLGKCRQSR